MKVLMISTDRKIFEAGSAVRARMRGYAADVEELFIVILGVTRGVESDGKLRFMGLTRWRALRWRPDSSWGLVTAQDPFETGLIGWVLARRLKTKLELQVHTDFLSPHFRRQSLKNRVRVGLAKFLLPRADQIRVVSKRLKTSLETRFNKLRASIEIRPIAVDLEQIRQAPITTDLHHRYPQFTKIILMASRLTAEKNIGLAIVAMREVLKSVPQAGLIIVGAGPELKKLKAKSAKLRANIIFEPWADNLPSYYKTADLFLLTSFYEGYGLTLVEAQAVGCPIVSTDVGVAREVGATIVAQEPKAVAEGIISFLRT